MEYKRQDQPKPRIKPRLIIHGGAGNIKPTNLTQERYKAVRSSLLGMIAKTHSFMFTPSTTTSADLPSALEVSTFAVTLLENDPLFNAGKGAVFTRDGINQLEASVMVSRGHKKRAAGVLGLRHVRNPIQLARAILEHGEDDLLRGAKDAGPGRSPEVDAPSAQGHTLIYGAAAESLAQQYGLETVDKAYFFTQNRWDEHMRALEREKEGGGGALATWSSVEYLPGGTTGAVALDENGVVCCATSTGGLTNKLTGRIGDTPVPGAGYWAEEWEEEEEGDGPAAGHQTAWSRAASLVREPGAMVELAGELRGLLADCLPSPFMYAPVPSYRTAAKLTTTRSFATSGTGNGDSFLRVNAARTASAMARWKPMSSAAALTAVTGPGGELQRSAGDRWMKTGEGEGGMIGIESVVVRDEDGNLVEARSEIIQDQNCPGMFRAWVDDNDKAVFQVWHEDADKATARTFCGNGRPEDWRDWLGEKDTL